MLNKLLRKGDHLYTRTVFKSIMLLVCFCRYVMYYLVDSCLNISIARFRIPAREIQILIVLKVRVVIHFTCVIYKMK